MVKIFNFLTIELKIIRIVDCTGICVGEKKSKVRKGIIINICHPPPDGVKLSLRIDPDNIRPRWGQTHQSEPKILTPEESNVYRNNPALAPPGPGRVE
ncbi:hypothetical protein TBC1_111763 [Lentimicrobium saccharophilum]|uniref:Uncharacterized protein n=1 Tax=Lentimicrobium saccharophilum TaxID=1678841 RepID=A0A0S7BYK2_9BACT|nr:hypothetical protein TBC1_111763 [Lentimicrobium saccharophilum]